MMGIGLAFSIKKRRVPVAFARDPLGVVGERRGRAGVPELVCDVRDRGTEGWKLIGSELLIDLPLQR